MAIGVHTLRRKSNKLQTDRKERKSDRAALPTRRRTGAAWKEFLLDFKETISWVLLVPLCLFSFVSFTELLLRATRDDGILVSHEFRYFAYGVGLWLVLFALLREFFMIVYVFGHEWSHLLAAKMCGATVYDWHVGRDGGWVDTNRSNFFISLAPYLVPFYTVGVLLVYGIAGLFVNIEQVHAIHLGSVTIPFHALNVLCFLIGLTWCFHFTYTLGTLRIEQSDVKRNGSFFSSWLIVLCNMYVIAALLIAASPTLEWSDALRSMGTATEWTFGTMFRFIASTGGTVSDALGEAAQSFRNWHVK